MYVHRRVRTKAVGQESVYFFQFSHQNMAMSLNCFGKYYRCSGQSSIEVRHHTESLAKFANINRLSKYADKNGGSVMQLNLFLHKS